MVSYVTDRQPSHRCCDDIAAPHLANPVSAIALGDVLQVFPDLIGKASRRSGDGAE